MNKSILILHGWPRPLDLDSYYYKFFGEWGYDIIAPEILSQEFKLNFIEAKKHIEKKLNGRLPDVIMGISLGGLLAPYFAFDFPNSKMILIGTGPKLQPKAPGFKLLFNLARNKNFLKSLEVVRKIPKKVLIPFYKSINPFNGSDEEKIIYIDDMNKNVESMIKIPMSKENEVIRFVETTDNTDLLKTLLNQTLIFAGENDLLMPENLSEQLHGLIKNSRVVVSHGSHFDIITEPSFVEMKKFLTE